MPQTPPPVGDGDDATAGLKPVALAGVPAAVQGYFRDVRMRRSTALALTKRLTWLLHPEGRPADLFRALSTQFAHVGRPVCGKVWTAGEVAYRCRDCQLSDSSCICVECFLAGDHAGHDVIMYYSTYGGSCDCGDLNAWSSAGTCPKHGSTDADTRIQAMIDPPVRARIHTVLFRAVLEALMLPGELREVMVWLQGLCRINHAVCVMVCEVLATVPLASVNGQDPLYLLDLLLIKNIQLALPAPSSEELTTLLLELTVVQWFKLKFIRRFLHFYPALLRNSNSLVRLLNRVAVQLYNIRELTVENVEHHHLLDMVLAGLLLLLNSAADGSRTVDATSTMLMSVVVRVANDVFMILQHKRACHHLLFVNTDLLVLWVSALGYLQGANPQTRVTGNHVEYESRAWENTFTVELELSSVVDELVKVHSAAATDPDPDSDPGVDLERPIHDLAAALSSWVAWEAHHNQRNRPGGSRNWAHLPSLSPADVAGFASHIKSVVPAVPPLCVGFVAHERMGETLLMPSVGDGLGRSCFRPAPAPADSSGSNANVSPRSPRSPPPVGDPAFREALETCCRSMQQVLISLATKCGELDFRTRDYLRIHRFAPLFTPDADLDLQQSDVPTTVGHNLAFRLPLCTPGRPVSFHLPLHRALSAFLHSHLVVGHQPWPKCLAPAAKLENFWRAATEHVLRVQSLVAQIRSRLWVRNGHIMDRQMTCYQSSIARAHFFDPDLFFMQMALCRMDPNYFVTLALSKYGLLGRWLLCEDIANVSELSLPDSDTERVKAMGTSLLHLLAVVCTDRSQLGLPEATQLRRSIVHILASGDATHSMLVDRLGIRLSKHPDLEAVLRDVADYRTPEAQAQGFYVLKAECWQEVDRYFAHMNPRDAQNAWERYKAHIGPPRDAYEMLPCNTNPPAPLPAFAAVLRVLRCHVFLKMLFVVISESVHRPESVSEDATATALYLFGTAAQLIEVPIPATDDMPDLSSAPQPSFFGRIYARLRHPHDFTTTDFSAATVADFDKLFMRKVEYTRYGAPANELSQTESFCSLIVRLGTTRSYHRVIDNIVVRLCRRCKAVNEVLRQTKHIWLPDEPTPPGQVRDQESYIDSDNVERPTELPIRVGGSGSGGGRGSTASSSGSASRRQSRLSRALSAVSGSPADGARRRRSESTASSSQPRTPVVIVSGAAEQRAQEAAQRQADIMENFKQSQSQWAAMLDDIDDSDDDDDDDDDYGSATGGGDGAGSGQLSAGAVDVVSSTSSEVPQQHPVGSVDSFVSATGSSSDDRAAVVQTEGLPKELECLMCQGKPDSKSGEVIGLMAFVQRSAIGGRAVSDEVCGLQVSHCGHAIHHSCYQQYIKSLFDRMGNNEQLEGSDVADLLRYQMLCPMCRRLSNCVVPLAYGAPARRGRKGAQYQTMRIALGRQLLYERSHWAEPDNPDSSLTFALAMATNVGVIEAACGSYLQEALDALGATVPLLLSTAREVFFADQVFRPVSVQRLKRAVEELCPTIRGQLRAEAGAERESGGDAGTSATESTGGAGDAGMPAAENAAADADGADTEGAGTEGAAAPPVPARPPSSLSIALADKHVPAMLKSTPIGQLVTWLCFAVQGESPNVDEFKSVVAEMSGEIDNVQFLRRAAILAHLVFRVPLPSLTTGERELADFFGLAPATVKSMIGLFPHTPTLSLLQGTFQELYLAMRQRKCTNCNQVPQETALCIVCGKICCLGSACCADPVTGSGECTRHAEECTNGIGMFMHLRATVILVLINGERRTLMPTPYLDEHGEEDNFLHRGKPLYLNQDRLERLRKIWILRAFHSDTKVLQSTSKMAGLSL